LPENSNHMSKFVGSWAPTYESPPKWIWIFNADGTAEQWNLENFVVVRKSKFFYRVNGSFLGINSPNSRPYIRPYEFIQGPLFNGTLSLPRYQDGSILMGAMMLVRMNESMRNMIRE